MLESLFNFLSSLWRWFIPFSVVDQWEMGVILRLGKFRKVADPGFHWLIPFSVDRMMVAPAVVQTHRLSKQSITTKDGKQIVVSAVIKFTVTDIRAFLLDVFQSGDAIEDVSMGGLRKIIASKTWDECQHDDLEEELKKAVRAEVKKFGIEVQKVTLPDLACIRSIRLLQDKLTDEHDRAQPSYS